MTYWEPLLANEVERLHAAACRRLEEPGMRIQHPETVDILVAAGARSVDDRAVHIPRELVDRSRARRPRSWSMTDAAARTWWARPPLPGAAPLVSESPQRRARTLIGPRQCRFAIGS